jgi:hypothetical protein
VLIKFFCNDKGAGAGPATDPPAFSSRSQPFFCLLRNPFPLKLGKGGEDVKR